MIPEHLYDLAFQYRGTKLWKKLYDSDIFAVRLPDGKIGYCTVMGNLGDYIALGLYVEAKGWQSYRQMASMNELHMAPQDLGELLNLQDCMQCLFENRAEMDPEDVAEVQANARRLGISLRGRNTYPHFLRFRPGYVPWSIDDEVEQGYMASALAAAAEVARRLKKAADKEALGLAPIEEGGQVPLLEPPSEEGGGWRWSTTELAPPPPRGTPHPHLLQRAPGHKDPKGPQERRAGVRGYPPPQRGL